MGKKSQCSPPKAAVFKNDLNNIYLLPLQKVCLQKPSKHIGSTFIVSRSILTSQFRFLLFLAHRSMQQSYLCETQVSLQIPSAAIYALLILF